jgi:serine O-acetyltransferase
MLKNVRADFAHYSRFCCGGRPVWRVFFRVLYTHPAALGVLWYRFGAWAWRSRIPVVRHGLQMLYLLGLPFVRMYAGVQIQPQTRIGPGFAIMHFGGVVITRECEIGENCLLYHNVNIVTMKNRIGPRIGAHFYAGVGATIIGTICIEDHVTAGAGCVITKSVPQDAVVAGVPAQILRFRGPDEDPTENRTSRNRPGEWLSPQQGDDDNAASRTTLSRPDEPALALADSTQRAACDNRGRGR